MYSRSSHRLGDRQLWRLILRYGPFVGGAISAVIGGIWLLAWYLGIPQKWAATPVLTMKANTALNLFIAGVALILLSPANVSIRQRWIAATLSSVVFVIGAITLCEHIFRCNLGIDQLLFSEPAGAFGITGPNRMGPPASLSFTLIGAGLLTLAWRKQTFVPHLGFLVSIINLVPAVGYLYGVGAFYRIAHLTSIAWQTIPALMSLGFGLMLVSPESGPMVLLLRDDEGGKLLRRLLPATLLVPVLLGYLRTQGEHRGLYGPEIGRALLVISTTMVLSVLLWASAALLSRSSQEAEKAHQELRHLSAIVESSDDAIFAKSLNGIITSWNRGAERLYGYTAAEAIGCSVDMLIPNQRPNELKNILHRIADGERIEQYETERKRKDGSSIEVAVKISPILDSRGNIIGASSIAHDISDRKRSERALRESEARFRAVAENVPQMIWVATGSSDFSYLSSKWLNYTGTTLEQNAHGGWANSIYPEDRHRVMEIWEQAIATGGIFETEYRIRRHDGEYRWHMARAVPIADPDRDAPVWFGATTDIHDQKRAQEALIRSEKLASVGRMAATVAHEINNPLAMIMNSVFIALLDSGMSERARESLVSAEQELERVAQLTRQTLGFYRENALPADVDVAALVNEVVQLYAPKFVHRDITVQSRHITGLHVHAVAGEIRQVVSNVVANAIDATPRGGRVQVKTSRILLNGSYCARLTFADTGEGILSSNLKRVFEPFFTTKEAVGTGLGLWVSSEIVRRHHGTMRVRSRLGQGTVFSIFLPEKEHLNEEATGEQNHWQNAS